MKRCIMLFLMQTLMLMQDTGALADDFDAYRVVIERNIFSPDRHASSATYEIDTATTQTTATAAVAAEDRIDLLGTWITDRQAIAFTEGNRSEFSATPAVGEELGGWRIAAIDARGITLTDAERTLHVRVGERIVRGEGEDWRVTERGALDSTPTVAAPSESKSGVGGVLGSAAEIMKRMRERREKEK